MPVCKNMAELREYLQNKISETLADDVAKGASEQMQESIDTLVYGRYSPTKYKRRGDNGGLRDADNIVSELESPDTLAVMDIAAPSLSVVGTPYTDYGGTSFARWINDGMVPNIFNNNSYVWEAPAYFMEDTKNALKSNGTLKTIMKRGLEKRGLKVK